MSRKPAPSWLQAAKFSAKSARGFVFYSARNPMTGKIEAGFFARKIASMRIFDAADGNMNRSVRDVGGEVLAISQFTLAAQWRKGNRPSFSAAAGPDAAEHLYGVFCERLAAEGVALERGRFRTHMRIELKNDGPVTIIMDSAD